MSLNQIVLFSEYDEVGNTEYFIGTIVREKIDPGLITVEYTSIAWNGEYGLAAKNTTNILKSDIIKVLDETHS